jgi:outer membrane receptor protein involved in Fe transport
MKEKTNTLGCLLVLVLFACDAMAQVITGTILGTVTDSTGAVVVHAFVTISNQNTGAVKTIQTSESGGYELPFLPPGLYTVEVKNAGFNAIKQANISLSINQKYRADFHLAVARAAEEVVEVSANPEALQTDSSEVDATISTRQFENLPNINRNPMIFMTLVPGVVPRDNSQSVTALNTGDDARAEQSNFSVNGGRAISSDILLDGAPDTDSATNGIAVIPGVDTIEEMKILTNSFSAEYGRAAGGVIVYSTKSGGNAFHGAAFENYTGNFAAANSSGSNHTNTPLGDYSLNRFGGTFSGAVRLPKLYEGTDKTFFFVAYEGARFNQPQNGVFTVPTDLQRAGDFSQSVSANSAGALVPLQLYLPFPNTTMITQLAGGGVQLQRQQVPGANLNNVSSYRSSFGQQFVDVYPKPNHAPLNADGTGNYILTAPNKITTDQFTGRIDEQLTQDQRLFFRFTSDWTNYLPANLLAATKPQAVSIGTMKQFNPSGTFGYTRMIGSKQVVDVRAAALRVNLTSGAPQTDLTTLGFPSSWAAGVSMNAWPAIGMGALGNQGITWASVRNNHTTDYAVSGSYTAILNKWTLKTGAEYRTFFNNFFQPQITSYLLNSLPNFLTACDGQNCPAVSLNHAEGGSIAGIAAGELGLFDGPGFLTWKSPAMALRDSYYGFYSQNDWKVTPRLTMNLGLRWDLQPGMTDRHNFLSQMDFTAKNGTGTPGKFLFAGANGNPRSNTDLDYSDWGPRIGFAYRAAQDLVVRGGYGISYDQITGVGSGADGFGVDGFEPYSYITIRPTTGAAAGQDIMNTPFLQSPVTINNFANPQKITSDSLVGQSVKAASRYAPIPRIQMWNLTVEDRLPGGILASMAYVGSRGSRVNFQQYSINTNNTIDPAITSAARQQYIATGVDPLNNQVANPYQGFNSNGSSITANPTIQQRQLDLRYPAFSSINELNLRIGRSWYDSLQLAVQGSFANHMLDFGASYVFSRNEDLGNSYTTNAYGSSNANAMPLYGPDQVMKNKSLSVSQSPQRAVIYFTLSSPFGKGGKYLATTPIVNHLVAGWKLSDITTLQSGFPFNITGGEGFGSDSSSARPDLAGNPVLPERYRATGDGSTCQSLPDGTCVIVPLNRRLYFNPHAYKGRLVTVPTVGGGTHLAPDIYYYGSAPRLTNFYGPGTSLTNLSVSRVISIKERMKMEIRVDAANAFNHNMFATNAVNTSFSGTQTTGTTAGYSNNSSFGTLDLTSSPAQTPRRISFQAHFEF